MAHKCTWLALFWEKHLSQMRQVAPKALQFTLKFTLIKPFSKHTMSKQWCINISGTSERWTFCLLNSAKSCTSNSSRHWMSKNVAWTSNRRHAIATTLIERSFTLCVCSNGIIPVFQRAHNVVSTSYKIVQRHGVASSLIQLCMKIMYLHCWVLLKL